MFYLRRELQEEAGLSYPFISHDITTSEQAGGRGLAMRVTDSMDRGARAAQRTYTGRLFPTVPTVGSTRGRPAMPEAPRPAEAGPVGQSFGHVALHDLAPGTTLVRVEPNTP